MSRAKNDTYKKEDALANTIINLFADQKFRERLKKSYNEDFDDINLLENHNIQKLINRKNSNNKIIKEKRKAHLKIKNTNIIRSKRSSKSQIKNNNNYHKNFDLMDSQSEIETNSDIDSSKKMNPEEHPVIFFYENKKLQKQMYSFHRRVKNTYNLRCTDRQCKGTADYDIESGKVTINKPCTKNYENHSYIKEEIVIKKIRAKEITKDDLLDNIENQEIYFKYLYAEHQNLTYYDICNYRAKLK